MSLGSTVRCINVMKFGNLIIGNKHNLYSGIRHTINLFEASVPSSKLLLNYRAFCQENSEASEEQTNSIVDPAKDRSKVIPVEVSLKYLKSSAYKTTYGDEPVWKYYRRNHKGQFAPRKTRKMCIRSNVISTGNPCPICRDEYLVIHPTNTELLKQFISPHTGAVLSYELTGLCQKRHMELLVAIIQAKDMGLITFDLPFHKYDYSEYIDLRGGIAGVSCAESLAFLCPEKTIALVTASSLIKTVTNLVPLTKLLTRFDVEEKSAKTLSDSNPSLTVIHDCVTSLNSTLHSVYLKNKTVLTYKKLCICTGAIPKLIPNESKNVIGIRDTESVKSFQNRVAKASRIVIVGNGGIATEIVHELTGVEIIWVIKDDHISATFIDPAAAEFFQDKLKEKTECGTSNPVIKRLQYAVDQKMNETENIGAALGPDWHSKLNLSGSLKTNTNCKIEYSTEVDSILNPEEAGKQLEGNEKWPVYVKLTNGKLYGCDFVVSATGVVPCCGFKFEDDKVLNIGNDGGISVDWKMESNIEGIYAAGDACFTAWNWAPQWFQMRLWTQARQMGSYAAKAMAASLQNEQFYQDFCFELFSHVTKFFGYKVVLLGLYNGQTLDNNYEVLLRITKGVEFVKLVLKNGRLQGAILIGETDLEEMCENLILNQLDLTDFGEDLLNPNIDIEDYFD